MTDLLVSFALFVFLVAVMGLGPARMVAPSPAASLVIAPAAAGVMCGLAVVGALAFGTPVLPWLCALGVAGWAISSRFRVGGDTGRHAHDAWGVLFGATLVALAPILLVRYPATAPDALHGWWFRATWFDSGGVLANTSMNDPAYAYAHPSYPPLVSGFIASTWQFARSGDREVALRLTQLLTAAAIAALSFFTISATRLRRLPAVLAAAGLAWVAWSVRLEVGLQGLVDVTWAAFLAAAAVVLLASPRHRDLAATGALFAVAAAWTKVEGQMASLLLVPLAVWRFRDALGHVMPLLVGVPTAIGLWALVAPRPHRAITGDWSQIGDLLNSGTVIHERFVTTLSRFAAEVGPAVLAAAVVICALIIIGRLTDRRNPQPGLVSILLLALAVFLASAATFAIRPEELDFLLDGAAGRVTAVVRLLVLADLFLAMTGTLRSLCLLDVHLPSPDERDLEPGVVEAV